jgi:hypothetical protein
MGEKLDAESDVLLHSHSGRIIARAGGLLRGNNGAQSDEPNDRVPPRGKTTLRIPPNQSASSFPALPLCKARTAPGICRALSRDEAK